MFVLVGCALTSCDELVVEQTETAPPAFPVPVEPRPVEEPSWPPKLDRDNYKDKILGLLIGSAIGDAMGAPTEMLHRNDIAMQYGYVATLDDVVREGSPEGPWDYNLPGGGTTDDTRWKYLTTKFLSRLNSRTDSLDPSAFAKFIVDIYLAEKSHVGQVNDFDPAALETEIRHMTWLQEWAKVAQPYLDRDIDAYSYALNKFYGGEMSCAGMLYAPMIGGYFPGAPLRAYREAYRMGLFDLGYARDITALTAAYVAKAMEPGVSYDDIISISRKVDPNKYFKSRLVGRLAHNVFVDAQKIAHQAKVLDSIEMAAQDEVPTGYPFKPAYHAQVKKAYRALDEKLQDIPFHANEIHLINLTALLISGGDFKKAIEFVVNYGRDNDTVAAVTGSILGAYLGASKLPRAWSDRVVGTSRDVLGIDLEALADEMVTAAFP